MNKEKKVSEMISDVASAYIKLGKSIPEMQFYLDITCTSWNMALLSKRDQKEALKAHLKLLKRHTDDEQLIKCLREDILGIIKAKNDLFPNVKLPIIKAFIEVDEVNEYKVIAAFGR
ncbi:MAG: hypothetical protein WBM99_09015 [Psychromonas sp.]